MHKSELIACLKGAFSDHEITDIQIAGRDYGFHTIPAVKLNEDWALHPCTDEFGWTCTFIPNGLAIRKFDTLAQALMALGAIIALDLPWHLMTTDDDIRRVLKDLPDTKKALGKALKTISEMEIPVGDA